MKLPTKTKTHSAAAFQKKKEANRLSKNAPSNIASIIGQSLPGLSMLLAMVLDW